MDYVKFCGEVGNLFLCSRIFCKRTHL